MFNLESSGVGAPGESTEAWRTVLDDLIGRGLRRPQFLIVDAADVLAGVV